MIANVIFPTIDMEETGRRITAVRKAKEMKVRDLQEFFGFENPQAIYNWQRGKSLPSLDNLLALARLLQVSMEDLLVTHEDEDREVLPFVVEKREIAA